MEKAQAITSKLLFVLAGLIVGSSSLSVGCGGDAERPPEFAGSKGPAPLDPQESECVSNNLSRMKLCRLSVKLRAARKNGETKSAHCYSDRLGEMNAAFRDLMDPSKTKEGALVEVSVQERRLGAEQRISQLWDDVQKGVCIVD
jgi:hypothetical protein